VRRGQVENIPGRRRPVALVLQPKFFGFTPRDLVIDVIVGDSADIPQCSSAGAVDVKKKERPRFAGRELIVEPGDVIAIDGLEPDRQGDIP
jgi:hypothetical protein